MGFQSSLIKNPLTIVGIFAGLVEIAGTAVMPALSPAVQAIYVWFLMIFPALLVIAFFLTLFFRHHVLYAPSDFREDAGFHRWAPADPHAIELKVQAEQVVEELADQALPAPLSSGSEPAASTATSAEPASSAAETKTFHAAAPTRNERAVEMPIPGRVQTLVVRARPSIRERRFVEDALVNRFENIYGAKFAREMQFDKRSYVYDAVDIESPTPMVLEMKYTVRGMINRLHYIQFLSAAKDVYDRLSSDKKINFIFAFVYYTDTDDAADLQRIKRSLELLRSAAAEYPFKVVTEYFQMREALEGRTLTPVPTLIPGA